MAKAKKQPNKTINPGDVVRLRSGGPSMTVGSVVGGIAVCHWFDGDIALNGEFHINALGQAKP